MSYTIVDLLNKLIKIEQNGISLYKSIATIKNSTEAAFTFAARVLAREEERHIDFYENLKQQAMAIEDNKIVIDFDIYDKVSHMINQFNMRMTTPETSNVKELLKFALNFEKENLALLLDIQGRLIKTEEDSKTFNYKIMEFIIKEEQKHIENLQAFLKN